jgi:hypothetical protein
LSTQMSEEEIRKIATQRVQAKKGFYIHLTVYILVNLMLIAIWYFTGARHYFWPMWVLLFWGIGLIVNGVTVFAIRDMGWEKREVEKEIERLKKRES